MQKFPQVKVLCRTCRHNTYHEILHSEKQAVFATLIWAASGEEEDATPYGEAYWETVRCCGCHTMAFHSYEISYDDEELNFYDERIFPDPALHAYRERVYRKLPASVRETYRELVAAYNNGIYRLAAMGVRMVIEGMCSDLGITGSLFQKVEALKSNQYLSFAHAKILHELREQGNEAAHELYRPSKEELERLIEAVDTTLHVVYELNIIAADMQAQRQQRRGIP